MMRQIHMTALYSDAEKLDAGPVNLKAPLKEQINPDPREESACLS
jgi:hypothetical protein